MSSSDSTVETVATAGFPTTDLDGYRLLVEDAAVIRLLEMIYLTVRRLRLAAQERAGAGELR